MNHSSSVKIANHNFYSQICSSLEENVDNLSISVQFFVTCKFCINGTLVLEFSYKMKLKDSPQEWLLKVTLEGKHFWIVQSALSAVVPEGVRCGAWRYSACCVSLLLRSALPCWWTPGCPRGRTPGRYGVWVGTRRAALALPGSSGEKTLLHPGV